MWIRTRPSSAAVSLEARVPTKDRPVSTEEIVSFELVPTEERDHLDLDTGEVFQDYNYARLHKKEEKLISARITIRPLPDETCYQYNTMKYFSAETGDENHLPSSIHFSVFIEPTAFCELASNVKGGLYPKAITINLAYPLFFTNTTKGEKRVIEFGWEPDGSGKIWHNIEKESRAIPIESVTFNYVQSTAPADRVTEQSALIQASLGQMLQYARWITFGIAAIAVMIAIFMFKRGMLF
jgi:hypothetical protein